MVDMLILLSSKDLQSFIMLYKRLEKLLKLSNLEAHPERIVEWFISLTTHTMFFKFGGNIKCIIT